MKGIGVLLSGGGTNLQAIIDTIEHGNIAADINLVLSDRPDAYGLIRAEKGVYRHIVSTGKNSRMPAPLMKPYWKS